MRDGTNLRACFVRATWATHSKNMEASICQFSRRGPITSFTPATLCLSFPRVLFALLHPHHEHIQPSSGHGQSEAWPVHQRDQVSSLFTALLLLTFLQMLSVARFTYIALYCSNEMNYITSHPFSAVNLGAGSEVCRLFDRYDDICIYVIYVCIYICVCYDDTSACCQTSWLRLINLVTAGALHSASISVEWSEICKAPRFFLGGTQSECLWQKQLPACATAESAL